MEMKHALIRAEIRAIVTDCKLYYFPDYPDDHVEDGCTGGDEGSKSECLDELLPAGEFEFNLDGDCPSGQMGVIRVLHPFRNLEVDGLQAFAPVPEGVVQLPSGDECFRLGQRC